MTTPQSGRSDRLWRRHDGRLRHGSPAPITHIADQNGALLVDYSYGLGRVVVLSDPYIVSNGGIRLNDNLQLALNTLGYSDGVIAFDEYHQGRGISGNALASYFAGTPVLALAAQIRAADPADALDQCAAGSDVLCRCRTLIVVRVWSLLPRWRSCRSVHALSIWRSKTFTRAHVAFWLDMREWTTTVRVRRSPTASRRAQQSIDSKLETLMRQCEEAINGEPINWRQSIDLVRRLREVERDLGLRMRSREVRQAAENI